LSNVALISEDSHRTLCKSTVVSAIFSAKQAAFNTLLGSFHFTGKSSMSMFDQKSPYAITVEAGKKIFICRCGDTGNPPYCDGTHKNHPGVSPWIHETEKAGKLFVCGCKTSGNMPWCDGSHNNLSR